MNQVNCAYKCVPTSNGVMFIFDSIDVDGLDKSPIMNFFEGNFYLEFGDNIVLLNLNILGRLIETPTIKFIESPYSSYDTSVQIKEYSIEPNYIARLQGAIDAYIAMSS